MTAETPKAPEPQLSGEDTVRLRAELERLHARNDRDFLRALDRLCRKHERNLTVEGGQIKIVRVPG